MNGSSKYETRSGRWMAALALGTLGTLGCMSQAYAGCGFGAVGVVPAAWAAPDRTALTSAVYRPDAEASVRPVHDESARAASIVGMWRTTLVSDGTAYPAQIPLGVVIDFGTQQWHSDGTEFLISGARPPSTGDVCMGVWEQTGNRSYKLKHIALAYVSSDTAPPIGPVSPAVFVGPAIIREEVTLNHSRDSFEGTFTLDQYAKDEVTLLQHIAGKVIGTRFKLD